jgi:histidyl-tRNA synthetase
MHGPATPALGFGMGMERLLMIMEAENADLPPVKVPDIYLAPMGEKAALKCTELCKKLRLMSDAEAMSCPFRNEKFRQ